MGNFEDDTFDIDFATDSKKEKPKDLYNILESTIDSMGIVEPGKTTPMNQVVQADTRLVPEIAKPIDINQTHEAIGNLVIEQGNKELQDREREFDRQQRSNQTFGYRNASYTPGESNQGGFMRTAGVATPAASNTNAGTVSDFNVETRPTPVADFAANTRQGSITGEVVSQVSRPARRSLARTPEATTRQTPVAPQATPQERIPGVSLRPMQVDRSFYIMGRLMADGFTPEQAAGIVGNLMQESQLDHRAVHPNGGTFGIAQWRGPRIREYERRIGPREETTPEKQVDFMIWELNNTHRGAGRAIRGARTVEEASDIMRRQFERPREDEANDAARRRYSNQAHRVYQHRSRNMQ